MKSQLSIRKGPYRLFKIYAGIILAALLAAIVMETPFPLLVPVALIVVFQVLVDYEKIFLLLFLCIPLSTEFFISDHLATDLPTEPLIIGLMLIYLLVLITKPFSIRNSYIRHPFSILLLTHIAWITLTTFTSAAVGFSAKFLLAKIWYVVTFFYMTGHLIKTDRRIELLLWLVAVPLSLATTKVVLHHATLEFGFKTINIACPPFFRNHVNYAAILSLFLPFIWFLRKWTTHMLWRRGVELMAGILIFGVLTAYTRAAYVALAILPFAYIVIRLRLVKFAAIIASISILGLLTFLLTENKFMELVPTEQTVAHTELSDIVASTSELKDVSTMERYYRWIAAANMIAERPVFGFGPGNFYHFYKSYVLSRFATYVSDNPEKSGVHNYYLMTTLEQGFIGLIIFLLLIYTTIIYGETVYHASPNQRRKDLVMAALLSTLVIDAFLLINDMLETDKVGSFFFFNIAVIAIIDLQNRAELKAKEKAAPDESETASEDKDLHSIDPEPEA